MLLKDFDFFFVLCDSEMENYFLVEIIIKWCHNFLPYIFFCSQNHFQINFSILFYHIFSLYIHSSCQSIHSISIHFLNSPLLFLFYLIYTKDIFYIPSISIFLFLMKKIFLCHFKLQLRALLHVSCFHYYFIISITLH